MGIFFVYILKSSFSLALFYMFYRLLLNNETFHRFNRIMLLSLIVISSLLPLINTTVEHPTELNNSFMTLEDMLIMQSMSIVSPIESHNHFQITWYHVVVVIYFIGLLFFMLRNIWSVYSIIKLIRSGRVVEEDNGIKVILHNKKLPPFSWLKYIVISDKDYRENYSDILIHEKSHIARRHSYDIIVADIFVFIQWFNPSAWLLKQELKNIHEYEADDMVLKSGIDAKQYQLLLIEKAVGPKLYSIANNFNHSSLKKRITMMLKKKSNPWARMKYIYVLPIAALAVTAFARPEVNDELTRLSEVKISEISSSVNESIGEPEIVIETTKDVNEVNVLSNDDESKQSNKLSLRVVDDSNNPIKGATVIIEGTSKGVVTDNNGQFSLDVKLGEVIRISYVGKENLRFPVKESTMKMKSDLIMFDQVKNIDNVVVTAYGGNGDKKPQGEGTFSVVEKMPEYPGGMANLMKFLAMNIKYPVKAQQEGIQGRVIVAFTVTKDGSIIEPNILRSVSPEIDAEALRVVNIMPKWEPGMQRGEKVNVNYTIPINFNLTPKNTDEKKSDLSQIEGSPLYIIDGKELISGNIKDIDTNKIGNVEILKDAQSIEKYVKEYGEKANNGIVIITLKK